MKILAYLSVIFWSILAIEDLLSGNVEGAWTDVLIIGISAILSNLF